MTPTLILHVLLVSCIISKTTQAANSHKDGWTVRRMDRQCDRGNRMLDLCSLYLRWFFSACGTYNYVIHIIIQNTMEKINFKHCKTIQLMDILLETLSLHSAA